VKLATVKYFKRFSAKKKRPKTALIPSGKRSPQTLLIERFFFKLFFLESKNKPAFFAHPQNCPFLLRSLQLMVSAF
jgi:hypothetical protein